MYYNAQHIQTHRPYIKIYPITTHANSEIRAAREAECGDNRYNFMKRYCAKERAMVATKNMFPLLGAQCIQQVFEEAYNDVAPFQSTDSSGKQHDNGEDDSSFAGGIINGRVFRTSEK